MNAQTEEDQKEGVLNLFGTAFGLASQITAINAAHSSGGKSDGKKEIGVNEELNNLKKEALNKGWINESLAFDKLVKKILKQVFKILKDYFKDKLEEALEYLAGKLVDMLCGPKVDENVLGFIILHDVGENFESGNI